MLRELWSHSELVTSLVRRQYQLRYRQSAVGIAWAIIPPIATLGVATLVFHRVAGVQTYGTSYAVFAMSGLALWTFFASCLINGIPSIVGALPMVSRLPFPRAALPLSMIGLAFLDLLASLILFVVIAYVLGSGLTPASLWTPLLVLVEGGLAVGLVMLLSAINMFARDIKLAIPLALQLWLFMTPVMYPLDTVPQNLRFLYAANPMTGVIENAHRVLAYGQAPDFALLLPSVLGAVIAVAIGCWYFAATESRFADVI